MSFFSRRRKQDKIPKTSRNDTYEGKRLLTYQVSTLQGIGSREEQQDSLIAINAGDVVSIKRNGLLAAVADGMGGMEGGRAASEAVIRCFEASFDGLDKTADLPKQLCGIAFGADDTVYKSLGGNGGSTLAACYVFDEKLHFISVGDSSIYLMRDSQLCRLNRYQNGLNREYLRTICNGGMDPSEAREYREKAALTHFVGMGYLDEADYNSRPIPLEAEDVLLVCSDGVSGFMPEETLADCLRCGSSRDICSALESTIVAAKAPYQDNFTGIVIRCTY